jgi:hypothetical protein
MRKTIALRGKLTALLMGFVLVFAGCAEQMIGSKEMMKDSGGMKAGEEMKKDGGMMKDGMEKKQ